MAHIIDGKAISAAARASIAARREELERKTGVIPGLAVVIVGTDPASQVYVRNKKKACAEVGFYSEVHELSEDVSGEELTALLDRLAVDDRIHGILLQLPLPAHLNGEELIKRIPPEKDVDAFHPVNMGRLMTGNVDFLPCTPAGVMKMLEYEGISPAGKECVVIGRSTIVGKPMAMLLLQANGTVTVCHSHTKDLGEITRRADILIAAVGKPGLITADMVKDGAVVIDVGINRAEDGRLCGDVAFEGVSAKAAAISPVPGGVGVMTITMLLENTLHAAERYAFSETGDIS